MTEGSGFQLGVIGSLALSVASSVAIVICNKALMSFLGFPFATTLTSWHLMVTFCTLHAAQRLRFFEPKAIDSRTIVLFGLLNGTSIGLLNLSLGFNSIGFYQMTKLAIIPFTVLLETVFFKKKFSQSIRLSLLILLLGVGIASITDLKLNFLGSVLSLLAIATTCVGQIMTNTIQKKQKVSSTQLLYQSSPYQAAILFTAGPIVDKYLTNRNVFAHTYSPAVLVFIALSCLIAVSVNFSTFLVIGTTSPVTYQVLGHLKTCLVLSFGYALLHDPFTARNVAGILVAIFGMALYSYFCVRETNSKPLVDSIPLSQDALKTALIDSCITLADNGRETFHKNVFYIFTLYNSSNHNDQLKLGAKSSEEGRKWVQLLKEAATKECPGNGDKHVQCSKTRRRSFRLLAQARGRNRLHSLDWTVFSTGHTKRLASDVIMPSPWTIFDFKNGLRLFKEAKDANFLGMHRSDHPAIMAVGVVEAPSETIFQTVMSFGPSRSEWDFCLANGSVIEHLDGHTDIIHKKLSGDWLPWGMKRRDLLLRRYWRKEDDGTYVIVYHSVCHPNCQPKRGYIRVSLKSGGYVISPANQGRHSVVKHMLAIDWRFWKPYSLTSSSKYVTIRMLARVAALREFFQAKHGNCPCSNFSSSGRTGETPLHPHEREYIKEELKMTTDTVKPDDLYEDLQIQPPKHSNVGGSIVQSQDAADEFYDVPDSSDDCIGSEVVWSSREDVESQDQRHPMLSTTAVFVKKLQDLAAERKCYTDLKEASAKKTEPYSYGTTLPNDSSCTINCSWTTADPSTFLVRSESYFKDHQKVKASTTLMKMVAADWLKSDKREDDLSGREGGIVQRYANQGSNNFFFIINIQVPGLTAYNLVFYYMLDTPLEHVPLIENFVKGDDAYRNSRFKLIPYISKGSWIVKQSVGKKACLLGQALEINYFSGRNYLELGINIGSSTVARGVASLVLSYLNNLVIEMAFVIQGNTQEELPEFLLGTCRLNYLDATKAIHVDLC